MNLWAGGRDRARRDMLRTATQICGTENDTARNALIGEVIESFYDVLAADERLRHAEKLVATVRERRDEQAKRFEQGAVLHADLADVEARLAEAEAGRAHVAAGRSRSLAALAIALGLPAASALAPADGADAVEAPPEDYQAGLAEALKTRPELTRARLMTRRFELGVSVAKSEFLPRLDAAFSIASYREDDPLLQLDRSQKVWMVDLGLSIEIFDGGARAARVAKAAAELDEFHQVDRKTTLGVELDVRSAYLRRDEARSAFAAAEKRLVAAREMRELKKTQYEEGAATLASSLEGEQMLTDALMGRTNASFELRKSEANVARALGFLATQ
jgi:outer membrane protein TolC